MMIPFNSVVSGNSFGIYNTGTYRFTANIAGLWEVQAAGRLENYSTSILSTLILYKNGVAVGEVNNVGSASLNQTVSLALNDYIEIGITNSGPSTTTISTGRYSQATIKCL